MGGTLEEALRDHKIRTCISRSSSYEQAQQANLLYRIGAHVLGLLDGSCSISYIGSPTLSRIQCRLWTIPSSFLAPCRYRLIVNRKHIHFIAQEFSCLKFIS